LSSFSALAFDQPGDRDAGPARDDLGDLVLGDLLAQQALPPARRQPLLSASASFFSVKVGELAVRSSAALFRS
jgi:hypothetical protein